MRPRLGYLIGSHVAYQHAALPKLLDSMTAVGIDLASVVVHVNGSAKPRVCRLFGAWLFFHTAEHASPFVSLLDHNCREKTGVEHWLFLNCVSKCGPRFRELAEAGFDPEADATLAGDALWKEAATGRLGPAINDLAVYRYGYLETQRPLIDAMEHASMRELIEWHEGRLFAMAPRQAAYPRCGYELNRQGWDVYGSGHLRAMEYYPGLDLWRYKKNFGQISAEDYASHYGEL